MLGSSTSGQSAYFVASPEAASVQRVTISVLGFLCESTATTGQRDISGFGGWRAFRRSLG